MDEGEVLQVMISFRKATNTDSNEEQGRDAFRTEGIRGRSVSGRSPAAAERFQTTYVRPNASASGYKVLDVGCGPGTDTIH